MAAYKVVDEWSMRVRLVMLVMSMMFVVFVVFVVGMLVNLCRSGGMKCGVPHRNFGRGSRWAK